MNKILIPLVCLVFLVVLSGGVSAQWLVEVSVSTDKAIYYEGEPIQIFVTAYNPNPYPVTLNFSSSCQANYIIDGISDPWVVCLTVLTSVDIPPYSSYTWGFVHDPAFGEDVFPVPIGYHTIIGEVIGYGWSEPITFEVIPGQTTTTTTTTTTTSSTTTTTLPSPGGQTPIDSCTTINSPGVYVLMSDISGSGTCITIESSDVVFDGAGHSITGPGSSGYGVYVYNGSTTLTNVTVKNVTVTKWGYGIHYQNMENGGITDNNARSNSYGIFLSSSGNNVIKDSSVSSNTQFGIYLGSSGNNTLTNNTANSNALVGIFLDSSSSNTITDNNALNNSLGIYNAYSSNNTLTNNIAKENNYHDVYVSATSDAYCNNIIENNTGSGDRPIKYFNYSVTLQDEVLSDLILCNADNSNISNVTIEGSATKKNNGLLIIRTDNSNFTNINSSNNWAGIWLSYSSNNTLTNNNANSNDYYGIYLWSTSSSNNTLTDNTVSNNNNGINLDHSSNNTLTNNNASNNNGTGIYFSSSSGNTIYNNLFNNTNNFIFGGTIYNNTWNTTKTPGTNVIGGPYIGGNFWAKPDGTGFSETCIDNDIDGICDSGYTLASGNVDYLPLAVLTPSINISKVMTSGKTTVNTETKEYWVIEIEVINDGLTDLGSVVVMDTIPEEITLDDFTTSKGSVAATAKNGATKLTWTIGTTSPGDVETLVLNVSTKTEGNTQYFLEAGEYVLNQGASVSANDGQVTAGPTDPITVYAQTTTRHRGRMGGGGRHSRSTSR